MITSILLFLSVSLVSTTVAFLYYVPILDIIAAWVVGIGLISAYVGGFASGRMRRRGAIRGVIRRRRSGPVIPIDRGFADHSADAQDENSGGQADRNIAVIRLRKASQP